MVARASTRMLVGVVVVLALTPVLVHWAGPAGRAQQRMSRAHSVLNTAIDCYRRGEYEQAAIFFQQAQSMQEDLTAAEKDELTANLLRNNQAIQARRDGAEQVRRAEEALRAGRTQEANLLLKDVVGNQFLTGADKQRRQQLMQQLNPAALPWSPPASPDPAGDGLARARAKIQQARALMAKSNYDAAEALAKEADSLGAAFSPAEDTPKKVLEDIDRVRTSKMDAKQLLAAARASL